MSLTFDVELNYVKLVQLHTEADVYTFSCIILVPNTHNVHVGNDYPHTNKTSMKKPK